MAAYEFRGHRLAPWKQNWTNAYRELQSLYMFAPTAPGSLDRMAYVGSKRARSLVRSPIFPDRGSRFVKQVHRAWLARQV